MSLPVVVTASESRLRSERVRHRRHDAAGAHERKSTNFMTQPLYAFKALPVVLAALILSGPANAGKEETPFKGTSSGIVSTIGFDPEQNIVYTRLEGQGEA